MGGLRRRALRKTKSCSLIGPTLFVEQ